MLPKTTTTDQSTDTSSTSTSSKSKQDDYFYDDKNDDGPLLHTNVNPFAPSMAPNSNTWGPSGRNHTSLRGLTTSSSFQLDAQQHHIFFTTKQQTVLFKKSLSITTTLPSEILISILSYLTVEQLLPSQLVSRQFRQFARTVLLDKFAGSPHSSPLHQHDPTTTTTIATTSTMAVPNIPNPTTTTTDPQRTISLYLFPDPHHPPARWHECQSVVFECTAINRLQEVLLFQPVNNSTSTDSNNSGTLTILQHPFSHPSHHTITPTAAATATSTARTFRNMEIETELMRRAIRFHSPAIGLNLFDYSTGQRSRSTSSSSSSLSQSSLSSSMMTLQNPYLRSLGYDTTTTTTDPLSRLDPTTRANAGGGLQNESLVEGYSVVGVKHGGWSSSLVNQGMEGGYHWSMSGRNGYVGDGGSSGSSSEMDKDDEEMLCLLQAVESTRVASGLFEVVVDGEKPTMTGTEKKKEKRGAKLHEINIQSPKVHRHRLLQPQQRQGRRGGQSAQFTRYCCLHHDQYQQQQQRLHHTNETTNTIGHFDKEEGTVKTGNKDWWIEYRPIPIEAPVCQSCPQHAQDRDQAGHSHHGRVGGGGGIRIEFGQLRVSLDWILSGFMKV